MPERQTEDRTQGGTQHAAVEQRRELTGRTLGDFVVRDKIGEGGFGQVYRAQQPLLEREAVIKVLQSEDIKSGSMVQRFLREAKLASRLDHPFAAHIYAFGAENDGLLWIAMELVRGTPLGELLRAQGPLPLQRFVPFFEKLCEVVQTAHEQGIIHRDLKPANVMVISRAGRIFPKLLDLGIAKFRYASQAEDRGPEPPPKPQVKVINFGSPPLRSAARLRINAIEKTLATGLAELSRAALSHSSQQAPDGEVTPAAEFETENTPKVEFHTDKTPKEFVTRETLPDITQARLALGSPSYMAPEQWADSASVDARTDVYALGVLAYQCLTGKKPFDGPDALALRTAHLEHPVPPLSSEFPGRLSDVLRKAMAKDPAERFESALQFAREVRDASGLTDEAPALPQLDPEVRELFIAEAPQPLAEAVALLEAARQSPKAVHAIRLTMKVAVRYLAVLALASRARMGLSQESEVAGIAELLQKLRSDHLEDLEWWNLTQELCRPFATCRDAHPIPELVDLFFEPGGERVRAQSEIGAILTSAEAEEMPDSHLVALLSELAKFLRRLSFVMQYPLTVARRAEGEQWMGQRRLQRNLSAIRGQRSSEGQFFLSNGDGQLVLQLWPLAQAIAPTPGAPEEAFFLDGNGRLGAKLAAFPVGFERYDESLWNWFRENVSDVETGGARKEDAEQAPYIGLSSFSAAQAGLFFGREREAESFANRLRVQPLMGVVGPSGAGKSSFIQAGVVPLVAADWSVITVRPGPSPINALGARLCLDGIDAAALKERVRANPDALGELLSGAALRQGKSLLLVIDQFEELITLCADAAERNLYAQALAQAAIIPDSPVRVVLTLRDDFLIRVQQLSALRERLTQGLHLLGTPQREDLLRILVTPAQRSGYEFEDQELTREMVDAVADQPGALALLSFTASKLWDFRDRHLRQLTRKAYQALGGVGGALAHHAEATLGKMEKDEQRLVREAFRHLITAEGTRAVLTRKEIGEVLGGGERAENVLEQLIHARLLVASEGVGGEDRVEVIHEALLTSWPRLVTWQREDAENARMRDALRAGARQWSERGRVKGLLWRGEALLEYQIWRSRYPGSLTETEEAFAAASLREERRGRLIRRGLLVGAFVGLVVGMIILVRANGRAELNAKEARANAKVAAERLIESHQEQGRQHLLSGKPQEALVLLSQAYSEGAQGNAIQSLLGKARSSMEGKLLSLEHEGNLFAASFSPDGLRIVTGGGEKKARIWDSRTGALQSILPHQHTVRTARFSKDGHRILTGSRDGTAKIWEAETGKLLFTLNQPPEVLWAEFSHDGKRVVTAGTDKTAQVWDAATGQHLLSLLGHTGTVTKAFFSPAGDRIATASQDQSVGLWNSGGQSVARLTLQEVPYAIQFSPNGQLLATGGGDGLAKIYESATGRLIHSIPADAGIIYTVSFSPDGRQLITAGDEKQIKRWDVASGKPLGRSEGHTKYVFSTSFSPDGQDLVSAGGDGTVRIWNARTGNSLATLVGHMDAVVRAEFSPDGARIVSAGHDTSAIVWDAHHRSFEREFRGHTDEVVAVAFAKQGKRLVTASMDRTIKLWDVADGRLLGTIALGDTKPTFVAAASQGDRFVTGNGERDLGVNVWDFSTGRTVVRLSGHQRPISGAAFSPDGQRVATVDPAQALIHDLKTGRVEVALTSPVPVGAVAFSPDGKRVLTARVNDAVLWDSGSGAELLVLKGHRLPVRSLSFSSDGQLVLTTGQDQSVRVWDANTGKQMRVLEADREDLLQADIASDSKLIVAVGAGKTAPAFIWDVATEKIIDVIRDESWINAAAFSSQERVLVTAAGSGISRIWNLPLNRLPAPEVSAWVACHVPFRLEGASLIREKPDSAKCRH